MQTAYEGDIDGNVRRMVLPPESHGKPYLIGGPGVDDIHAAARRLKKRFDEMNVGQDPVCLATGDKAAIAAALVAAAMGGPPLILPYALTAEALSETRKNIAFSAAVVSGQRALPQGVTAVPFGAGDDGAMTDAKITPFQADRTWVYLFTGGSTGAPKIWSKSAANLLGEVRYLQQRFEVTDGDRILSTAPPNHIYGLLYSVLLPLAASASVFHATPSYPEEIMHAVEESRATILIGLPVHYRALNSHPVKAHSLRMAFSSAGALDPKDDAAFYAATGVAVTEVYGSTETGGVALRCRAMGSDALNPFPTLDWRIESDRLKIRSPYVSREIPLDTDGFFTLPDRVSSDGSGGFRILGRGDGVVKVGGKRVDLGQVQEILKRSPGIRDAFVFSVPTQGGRENEVRAVVEGEVDPLRLRESVLPMLEPYARPRQIKRVERMPVTAAGKYDRDRIAALFERF